MRHIVDDIDYFARVRINIRHEPVAIVLGLDSMTRKFSTLGEF